MARASLVTDANECRAIYRPPVTIYHKPPALFYYEPLHSAVDYSAGDLVVLLIRPVKVFGSCERPVSGSYHLRTIGIIFRGILIYRFDRLPRLARLMTRATDGKFDECVVGFNLRTRLKLCSVTGAGRAGVAPSRWAGGVINAPWRVFL
ncbi:hypothetical protein EVAR_56969_1 [Eumeta japonica]|uniref:Uncharacterized protein n=1 Tax=Eumeta variegata TaxID=151549 RepID=A0A4C1ZCF4_EUMVA|nr:hypothetical protein EVAR_56969_1 [Eumeta japonica]